MPQNVVRFLLKCEHDTSKLINDKSFVCDLMLVAKSPTTHTGKSPLAGTSPRPKSPGGTDDEQTKNMDILEEFVLASSAPIDTAAKLSRAFMTSSNREKEQAKNLVACSNYCENLAVDLLEICRSVGRCYPHTRTCWF